MPTPTGLPRVGERLRHKDSGQLFTVVHRTTGQSYSLVLKLEAPLTPEFRYARQAYGYPAGHMWLTEAGWWLGRTYEFVEEQ